MFSRLQFWVSHWKMLAMKRVFCLVQRNPGGFDKDANKIVQVISRVLFFKHKKNIFVKLIPWREYIWKPLRKWMNVFLIYWLNFRHTGKERLRYIFCPPLALSYSIKRQRLKCKHVYMQLNMTFVVAEYQTYKHSLMCRTKVKFPIAIATSGSIKTISNTRPVMFFRKFQIINI